MSANLAHKIQAVAIAGPAVGIMFSPDCCILTYDVNFHGFTII